MIDTLINNQYRVIIRIRAIPERLKIISTNKINVLVIVLDGKEYHSLLECTNSDLEILNRIYHNIQIDLWWAIKKEIYYFMTDVDRASISVGMDLKNLKIDDILRRINVMLHYEKFIGKSGIFTIDCNLITWLR